MPRLRTYECPSCGGQFEELHMTADEPAPDACPLCHFSGEEAPMEPQLSAPKIATGLAARVDDTYRAAEEGAEFRAQYAQESLGLDSEAARALKITDMRSNTREGDVAAAPVVNPVSQFMDANPHTGGFAAGAANYAGYSQMVRTGDMPNAGLRAQMSVRKAHANQLANSGHKGAVSSEAPALEVLNPNYTPRVRTI